MTIRLCWSKFGSVEKDSEVKICTFRERLKTDQCGYPVWLVSTVAVIFIAACYFKDTDKDSYAG